MACAFVQKSEIGGRKLLIGKEMTLRTVAEGSILVTKWGTPFPLFFVSAESKRLKFCGRSLESTLVGDCVCADSKGVERHKFRGTRLLAEELTRKAESVAMS